MTVKQTIEQKLTEAFDPVHLEVIDESHMHNVPEGAESHFKVIVVSERFRDEKLVARHRLVNSALKAELDGPVHALSMRTWTPEQWQEKGGVIPDSPPCMGGGG